MNPSLTKIKFSDHAKLKFEILTRHHFVVTEKQVKEAIVRPDRIEQGKKGRMIAQKAIDERHILRVVYEHAEEGCEVITFYPGRRGRYEDKL